MNLNITDIAQDKLKEIMKTSEYEEPALRLRIAGFGWGGPSLGIALDESKNIEEGKQKIQDINILIDEEVNFLVGKNNPITIDYYKNEYQEGFTIDSGSSC